MQVRSSHPSFYENIKRVSLLSGLLVFLFLLAEPSKAGICSYYLEGRARAQPTAAQTTADLESTKSRLLRTLSDGSISRADVQSRAEKLALLTIIFERGGIKAEAIVSAFTKSGESNGISQKTLNRILDSLNFNDGIRRASIIGAIQRMIILDTLGNRDRYHRLLRPDKVVQEMIAEKVRVANALDVALTFLDQNSLSHPLDLRERLATSRTYQLVQRFAISTVINTFALLHLGTILDVPSVQVLDMVNPPPHIKKMMETQGVGTSSEITNYFWKYAAIDLTISTGRRAFFVYLAFSGLLIGGQELRPAYHFIRPLFVSEQRLATVQQESFSAERIRKIQFESWKQSFYGLEGRWPDPTIPADKSEIDSVWGNLLSMSEEELRVRYGSGS